MWALFVPIGSVLPTGGGCARAYGVCSSSWCRFCLCLFFQLVWLAVVPAASAEIAGEGFSWESHLLVQVVLVPRGALLSKDWVVLVPLGAADFDGDGWPGTG